MADITNWTVFLLLFDLYHLSLHWNGDSINPPIWLILNNQSFNNFFLNFHRAGETRLKRNYSANGHFRGRDLSKSSVAIYMCIG